MFVICNCHFRPHKLFDYHWHYHLPKSEDDHNMSYPDFENPQVRDLESNQTLIAKPFPELVTSRLAMERKWWKWSYHVFHDESFQRWWSSVTLARVSRSRRRGRTRYGKESKGGRCENIKNCFFLFVDNRQISWLTNRPASQSND